MDSKKSGACVCLFIGVITVLIGVLLVFAPLEGSMPADDIAILRVNDNENNGPDFARGPLERLVQGLGPVQSIHRQFPLAGTNAFVLGQDE